MLGLLSIAFPFSRRLRGGSSDYLGKGRPPALRDAAESPHDATGSGMPGIATQGRVLDLHGTLNGARNRSRAQR
jgi:hypothetical protein